MNDDDAIDWNLVGRVLTGEATDVEQRHLDDWLKQHPGQRPHLDALRTYWQAHPPQSYAFDAQGAFERLQHRITTQTEATEPPAAEPAMRRLPAWGRGLGWAAAASVVMVLSLWLWQRTRPAPNPPALVQQANPKGTRSQIRLTDGSVVWLNADSQLRYPKAFTGTLREVWLDGEAFFEVAHNAAQPFVVRLKTGSVRVLGTSFNVRAYPGDSTVETAVVSGRVAFVPTPNRTNRYVANESKPADNAPADTLFLLPNVKAIQSVRRQVVIAQPTVAANQIAWTQARLVFRNTPMGEVAKTLERWYGTPVRLEGDALRQCPLTGTFENQSLREVMSLIALTNRFNYEYTAQRVTIRGPGGD